MTHSDVPTERATRIGVTPGMVRISVGLEDVVDLKADFDRALRRVS